MVVYTTKGGVRYILTDHALRRMAQRGVAQEDLDHTFDSYDSLDKDRRGNDRYEVSYLGRRIRVIGAKDSNPIRVITVVVLG